MTQFVWHIQKERRVKLFHATETFADMQRNRCGEGIVDKSIAVAGSDVKSSKMQWDGSATHEGVGRCEQDRSIVEVTAKDRDNGKRGRWNVGVLAHDEFRQLNKSVVEWLCTQRQKFNFSACAVDDGIVT